MQTSVLSETTQKPEFSFLQWNTLNSEYSNVEAFPKAAPQVLTWEYRKSLIEGELKKIQADIMCMEEVNANDVEFIKNIFQDNYDLTYQKKGKSSEGLCFLYSKEKFEGIQSQCESYKDDEGKPQSYVYQVHILRLKNKENHFLVVGLTHLKSKSAFASARLKQVEQFVKFLKATTEEFIKSQSSGVKVATVVGGDFNDEPNSEVLQLMKRETNLKSAFEGAEFTTFKYREKEYCRVIDYILYDDQALSLEKKGEIPLKTDLGEFGLPNEKHPSDHLPLYCTFSVKDKI